MNEFIINGQEGQSKILVGESFGNLKSYLPHSNVVVITDMNIYESYKYYFADYETILIGSGETIKTFKTVQKIIEALIKIKADRSTFLLGVGGGIICDITGFVASIYMRGMDFGFVATSLLAQVDASVGGKNGVNFTGYKNLLGVFNQPEFVICDTSMLKTLPKVEISNGLAEILKHTLIADKEMFAYIEEFHEKALALDEEVINGLILNSVKIKAGIVNQDEHEKGVRRLLNLGHTFGHAIEKEYSYPHGFGVALGINITALLSVNKGYLNQLEYTRILSLLEKLELPTKLEFEWDQLLNTISLDKKRDFNQVYFIYLRAIGEAVPEKVALSDLAKIKELVK